MILVGVSVICVFSIMEGESMLRETRVKNGMLRGLPGNDPRVTVYRGVPFAAPPVGENRWRAPRPCEDWDGVREAYTFGPISVQDQPGVGDDLYCREWHVDKDIPMSEDCLYLNIWTPAKRTDEKLPVLFWIFGGGFQWGYTAEMEFNGERLARRGIVVVSVGYRLAALGFMAHPEITKEAPGAPANFGLLDQRAGLEWVYENIAAFGGDPANITIAGQSAGGGSVLHHITDPDNYHVLKGAAIISGMIRFPGDDDDILKPITLERAQKAGSAFFEFMGVSSLKEARELDAFYIRDKYAEWVKEHPRFAPVIDGVRYKDIPLDLFVQDKKADIPIITGYTADEFEFDGQHIVEMSVRETIKNSLKVNGSRKYFLYEFAPDIPGEDNPGVFHSCDLWFWFDTISMCHRPYRGRHYDLARRMANYLADFVKVHDPNGFDDDGSRMEEWKCAAGDDLNIIRFS